MKDGWKELRLSEGFPAAEGWDILPVLSKSGESSGPGAELLPPVWPGGCPDRGHSDRGHCAHREGGSALCELSTFPINLVLFFYFRRLVGLNQQQFYEL